MNSHCDLTSRKYAPALLATLFAAAVGLYPTHSVARDGAAIIGSIVGVAAAAIVANGIAQQHQQRAYRPARHRKHVASRSRRTASQSTADPFAGVAAPKTRAVSGE